MSSHPRQTTAHQALHGGQRVSVRAIIDNELHNPKQQQQNTSSASSVSPSQNRSAHSSSSLPAAHKKDNNNRGAVVPVNTKSPQQQQHQQQRSNSRGRSPKSNDPYELVKRAMANEEKKRVAANQNMRQYLGQKTVRSRNLRFEQGGDQQNQQRSPSGAVGRGGGKNNKLLLASAQSQPTSFVSPSRRGGASAPRPQDLRIAVNNCVRSEFGRVFLTEEETRALSGGKVCFSVSQRTTAFGSSAPHTETVQEPFCLLAVNIARALVPGISHAAMVRRTTALLQSPTWGQKLSAGVSLLAHGALEVELPQEAPPQEQEQQQIEEKPQEQQIEEKPQEQEQKEEPATASNGAVVAVNNEDEKTDSAPAADSLRQEEDDQQEKQQQPPPPPPPPVRTNVQWAMMHVPMDMPSLFVSFYVPPPAELLLPVGFEADTTSFDEMLRLQQQRQAEEEAARKRSHEGNFAQNFVGEVFHNIGLDSDDYEEGDEEDQRHHQRQDGVTSPSPVPPIPDERDTTALPQDDNSSSPIQNPQQQQRPSSAGGRSTGSGRIYNSAGEFVDDVFSGLLGERKRNSQAPPDESGRPPRALETAANSRSQQQQQQDRANSRRSGSASASASRPRSPSGERRDGTLSAGSPSARGGLDSTGIANTVAGLNLESAAHRDVAMQVCLAVETFLALESHGRKVKRVVVACHSVSAPMASDVVMALRARQMAKGQSRRVLLVTTQANIASSVPRRRLEGKMRASTAGQQHQHQEEQEDESVKMIADRPASRGSKSPKSRQQQQRGKEKQRQKQQQPDGVFSEWPPEDRARALRLFFARLCIPVPKLTFDTERRRGWRFVVMPDCLAWAIGYFAPGAVLHYQSLEFPQLGGNVNQDDQQQHQQAPPLPPSVDDIVRHLWTALSRVEGAIDNVTGGATLEGFVLAATTLLNGLLSREVGSSIWDEVFSSKFTASIYPPGTPIPTPPPVCSCCGAIGSDYYCAREASFIRQLKSGAQPAMKAFLKRALKRPFDPVALRTSGGGGATGDDYDEEDEDQRREDEAAADWNRCFFAESFHAPHEVLSRVNARFLPPLTALFSSHLDRTADTYGKSGVDSAAKVRLRLTENIVRAQEMEQRFQ